MPDKGFWKDKKVFITGHTGFKGSWLCLWLHLLGARISGYALEPDPENKLFSSLRVEEKLTNHFIGDITDVPCLSEAIKKADPEIVIHMAAQPLVIDSYNDPVRTYQVNMMGTVFLLEAVRSNSHIKAVLNVTTDKVYRNNHWHWGYREIDQLGGSDPYSNSKSCSDLITQSYRKSFFNNKDSFLGIAAARAGNVIGGGDYARNRLVPDIVRAHEDRKKLLIRYPMATRPWQHVLEPLCGYLVLAEKLVINPQEYSQDFNFGPDARNVRTVQDLLKAIQGKLDNKVEYEMVENVTHHEEILLTLDSSKAHALLNWWPRWDFETTVDKTMSWFQSFWNGEDVEKVAIDQILDYRPRD